MTRKHGWQCLPGSGRTRGCFDGNYDRDDIYFVYPDDEGTRDTAAPLADQDPGFDFTVYVLRDSVTGILYAVDFAAATLTLTAVTEVDEDTQNGPFDWLEAANGWRLYVWVGTFRAGIFSVVYCPSAPGANQELPSFTTAPGNVTIVPPGEIIYTPPGDEPPEVINPPEPPPLVLRVNELWDWQFIDGIQRVNEPWTWSDPDIGTRHVNETWES